jgi:hypothetical protein
MLKLQIETVGRPEWPRWIIKDEIDRVFTGSEWSGNRKEALLFADRSFVELERNRLSAEFVPQVFQVNVLIEVLSNQPLSMEQIKEYMTKHARVEINSDGEHPCSYATFDVEIDWDTFST